MGLPTPARIGPRLRKRQEGLSEEVKEIAWKAQHRLHKRYRTLSAAGKEKQKVITAVGRELWALSGLSEFKPNETANESHKQEAKKQSIPGGEKNERAKIIR